MVIREIKHLDQIALGTIWHISICFL